MQVNNTWNLEIVAPKDGKVDPDLLRQIQQGVKDVMDKSARDLRPAGAR